MGGLFEVSRICGRKGWGLKSNNKRLMFSLQLHVMYELAALCRYYVDSAEIANEDSHQ